MALVGAKITNAQVIEKALLDAFEEWAAEDINDAHWDDQFREDRWNYDGVTERRNGLVVTSPRDIYDIGELYRSGIESFTMERSSNMATAKWHWDATNASGREYAWYVHEGLGTNATPRPFTDDISIAASFFRKAPGRALNLRVGEYLARINAR
jgi:hypothetical protein